MCLEIILDHSLHNETHFMSVAMKKTIYANSKCSTLRWVGLTGMILNRTSQRHMNMMNTENFVNNLMQSITRNRTRALRARKSCLYVFICINIQTYICTTYRQ